jgi:hypothetical protein
MTFETKGRNTLIQAGKGGVRVFTPTKQYGNRIPFPPFPVHPPRILSTTTDINIIMSWSYINGGNRDEQYQRGAK